MGTAENINGVRPYRIMRSLARTGAQVQKGRELRHAPADTEQAAWCLLLDLRAPNSAGSTCWVHTLSNSTAPSDARLWNRTAACMCRLAKLEETRRGVHLKKMGYVMLRFSKGMVQAAPELLVQQIWDAVWSLPEALG